MDSVTAVPTRRAGSIAMAMMVFALLVVMLAAAVPARAATAKVRSGSSQMLVDQTMVTELQSKHTSINAIAPMTYKPLWTKSGMLRWWFRAPMVSGGTYNCVTKTGMFYHNGSMRWIEASGATHLQFQMEGIRILALAKNSYQMSVTYQKTAGVYERITFAQATNTPGFTKNGKAIKIGGIQFKLTDAGEAALKTALHETDFSRTPVLFDTDMMFTLK
ncbi:MAG: hypothetical protein NTX16_14660 [Actinobacteria bacterium]|nr:hypothetical protein [Actinomycetota bacterium]